MKKLTTYFLIGIVSLLLLVCVARCFYVPPYYSPLARLRDLYICIAAYSQDGEGNIVKSRYPNSLQDLVNANIITEKTLKNITNGFNIVYYKPTEHSDDDFVILRFYGKNGNGECSRDGRVSSHLFKKP